MRYIYLFVTLLFFGCSDTGSVCFSGQVGDNGNCLTPQGVRTTTQREYVDSLGEGLYCGRSSEVVSRFDRGTLWFGDRPYPCDEWSEGTEESLRIHCYDEIQGDTNFSVEFTLNVEWEEPHGGTYHIVFQLPATAPQLVCIYQQTVTAELIWQ